MRRTAVKALCFKKAVLFPAWIPLANNLEMVSGHFAELMYKSVGVFTKTRATIKNLRFKNLLGEYLKEVLIKLPSSTAVK